MDDSICLAFDQLEREMRDYRKRIPARPLSRSETPKGGRAKVNKKAAKRLKASYDQCVANGTCTMCRAVKAEHGRLCKGCNDKQNERGRRRAAELSERRAIARADRGRRTGQGAQWISLRILRHLTRAMK